jgi:hypothetical protein
MTLLGTKNMKNSRNMREKYSFMSHEIWRWFHPQGCKRAVKSSTKPQVLLHVFCNPQVDHFIFHGNSWKSLIPCVSVCLWVTNFHHSFLGNYSSQMLEILAHSFIWYAIWWDSINLIFFKIFWKYEKYKCTVSLFSKSF